MSSSTSPASPAASAPAALDNPIFHDERSDIILRTADKVDISFRRLHLESASEVFEDMFSAGRSTTRKRGAGQRDIIDVAEESAVLELFLLFLHPRVETPIIEDFEELVNLSAVADKYSAKTVLHLVLSQGGKFCEKHAPSLLAYGIKYEHADLAVDALLAFDGDLLIKRHASDRFSFTKPRFTFAEIPFKLYKQNSHTNTYYFLQICQTAILDPYNTRINSWKAAADVVRKKPYMLTLTDEQIEKWLAQQITAAATSAAAT